MPVLGRSAIVLLAAATLVASAASSNATTGPARIYPPRATLPSPANAVVGEQVRLYGVSAVAPDDVWAVGTRQSASRVTSLIEHWDGSSWQRVPSPRIGRNGILEAVSAMSSDDAWAVGEYDDAQSSSIALVEHWDGTRWTVDHSLPTYRGIGLRAVSGLSSTSMFAVGYGLGGPFHSIQQAVTLRVDGVAHTLHRQASPPGYVQELASVSMRTATAGWAVGSSLPKFRKPELGVAEHWNGHRWVHVDPIQAGRQYTSLRGVDVAGPGDVWAVGSSANRVTGPSYKLVEHFAAGHWSVVPTPNLHATSSTLGAVSSAGPTDVWAVGTRDIDGVDGPFALHWDGTVWHAVDMPQGTATPDMVSVTDHAGATWAVGTDFVGDRRLRVIRDFWTGHSWVRR